MNLMMPRRKSNNLVPMRVHPAFRNWAKMEAAKRGKSIIKFSEEFGVENLGKQDVELGFKLNF